MLFFHFASLFCPVLSLFVERKAGKKQNKRRRQKNRRKKKSELIKKKKEGFKKIIYLLFFFSFGFSFAKPLQIMSPNPGETRFLGGVFCFCCLFFCVFSWPCCTHNNKNRNQMRNKLKQQQQKEGLDPPHHPKPSKTTNQEQKTNWPDCLQIAHGPKTGPKIVHPPETLLNHKNRHSRG